MGVQMLVGVIESPVWLHMLYVSLLTYLEHKVDEFFGRSGGERQI